MKHLTKFRTVLATGTVAAAVFAAIGLASIDHAHAAVLVCNAFGYCQPVLTCNAFGFCG